MKQRFLLCFLLCGILIYYALNGLTMTGGGTERIFMIVWLVFALTAAAGNLAAMLYTPRKTARKPSNKKASGRKRIHYYQ